MRPEGDDALCFAAGVQGAPFGAGVVHAYLAADRPPPQVVAGISIGALTAAVMWVSYRETQAGSTFEKAEPRRWGKLRDYVSMLSDAPYQFIWSSIPSQSDFFIELPPIEDRTVPESLRHAERHAARDRYRLARLWHWLSRIPIPLKHIAQRLEGYVRLKEARKWKGVRKAIWSFTLIWPALRLALYVACNPLRFPNSDQLWEPSGNAVPPTPDSIPETPDADHRPRFQRPILGWWLYLHAWIPLLLVVGCALWFGAVVLASVLDHWGLWPDLLRFKGILPAFRFEDLSDLPYLLLMGFWPVLVVLLALTVPLYRGMFRPRTPPGRKRWLESFLCGTGMYRSLIDDFHMRLMLYRLFTPPGRENEVPDVHLDLAPRPLIVAAPLQTLKRTASANALVAPQLWANHGSLIEALRAALASPPLLPPLRIPTGEMNRWVAKGAETDPPGRLDLVDGSKLRQNPLPALLTYLNSNRQVAQRLSQTVERPGIHVIYTVPLDEPEPDTGKQPEARSEGKKPKARSTDKETEAVPDKDMNIVDVGLKSIRLAQRLDTRLEVGLTNFISQLESIIPRTEQPSPVTQVFIDEIAPQEQIDFGNPLSPSQKKVLSTVAEGCRRTLERLYGERINELREGHNSVQCARLLKYIAPQRTAQLKQGGSCGLSEVCAECTQTLRGPQKQTQLELFGLPRDLRKHIPSTQPPTGSPPSHEELLKQNQPPTQPPTGSPPSYEELLKQNQLKDAWTPKIIFVASGGVFRGAFHIGMAAALTTSGVKPDIIVGSSVGSLIGAALAKMLFNQHKNDPKAVRQLLAELVDLFVHIDERVALTRPLRSMVRELAIRLARVRLSARGLSRMVRRGIRNDVGYTITGAPPQLIEAISTLLLLPHWQTRSIAAEFLAGHVTKSVAQLGSAMKKETLRRLDILYALMGSSLLEREVRSILSGQGYPLALDNPQPFSEAQVEFYCTTTQLNSERPLVLATGDSPLMGKPYDFVEACLASSAFPTIFAPRRESDVFPGSGRRDIRFADGGLFDNLPFSHGVRVVVEKQYEYRAQNPSLTALEFLRYRSRSRHLIITGALNVNPEETSFPEKGRDDIFAIQRRASSLKHNVKIRSFEDFVQRVHGQVERLLKLGQRTNVSERERLEDDRFLDSIVDPVLLSVFPASLAHLNSTFAFSPSLGLDEARVMRSIADGCFQTLRQLATLTPNHSNGIQDGLDSLRQLGRLRPLTAKPQPHRKRADESGTFCPYFKNNGQDIECPFARNVGSYKTSGVMAECVRDKVHSQLLTG